MIEQLARIRAELGITMLIAEQGLNLAAETCGRSYVVASGRIAAEVGPDVSERRLSELYLGSTVPHPT
jgi:ABC-type branched-subunit amino acid transport system ATPase component